MNNSGSSTSVVELQTIDTHRVQGEPVKGSPMQTGRMLGQSDSESIDKYGDRNETLPSPTTAPHEIQEKWNSSPTTMYRTFACFWGFVVMGMNDASYGAIITYLEEFYGLSYIIVSLIFLSPLVGYTLSAFLNNTIHLRFGQRGVAFLCPVCHLIAYIVISVHPPYPVLVIVFMLAGFGNGLEDSGWNAWMGNMANANEILGFLHGCYGAGATIAPLIATSMITKANLPWYNWYYIGAAVLEFATSLHSFWGATAEQFRLAHPRTTDKTGNRMKEALFTMPSARVTWLCAAFLLGYIYLPIAMALQLILWLVPNFYASAIAVSFQGFFLGPMFPAAVVATTKLLPRHLHVSGVGFAAALGGSGGALFPFAVGAIAQAKGVQVLQPIILALLAVIWLIWLAMPRMGKKKD
ncbi:hypothetical protein H2203_000872 [Taxawa tesnikishii (nom. ined.)]|nr:hypothetical protein H2203_000872 [Dothideales sp. JES 119]